MRFPEKYRKQAEDDLASGLYLPLSWEDIDSMHDSMLHYLTTSNSKGELRLARKLAQALRHIIVEAYGIYKSQTQVVGSAMENRAKARKIILDGMRKGFENTTDPSNYIVNQLMKAGFISPELVCPDVSEIFPKEEK